MVGMATLKTYGAREVKAEWPWWLRLTVDVPGDGPDLGIDVLQQAGLAHVCFEEGAVDGGEGFDGDKEVGAGGPPR